MWCAGHAYYFLEDVYPRITGRRPLKTPGFIQALFPPEEIRPAAVVMQHMPEPFQQQQQEQQPGMGMQGEPAADAGLAAQPQAAAAGGEGRPHED